MQSEPVLADRDNHFLVRASRNSGQPNYGAAKMALVALM